MSIKGIFPVCEVPVYVLNTACSGNNPMIMVHLIYCNENHLSVVIHVYLYHSRVQLQRQLVSTIPMYMAYYTTYFKEVHSIISHVLTVLHVLINAMYFKEVHSITIHCT